MFDIASTELLIIAVVALVVIGPKDLPRLMRTVGEWVGRARSVAKHFRTGMDAMIREAELEDLEKQWKAQNEQIMREHPAPSPPVPENEWGRPALTPPPAPPQGGGPEAPPADPPPEQMPPPAPRDAP